MHTIKSALTPLQFKRLPLVVEGNSKEIRRLDDRLVAIRLKPTIYSFTHNRAAVIPGSDELRLKSCRTLIEQLKQAGVSHSYQEVGERYIVSQALTSPYSNEPILTDRTQLPVAPPIEVIVKKQHTGTPKHRYYGMEGAVVRKGHAAAGKVVASYHDYPELVVRFDWRNPLHDHTGTRLADEVLPEAMADWFIDTNQAKATALKAFGVLDRFLSSKGLNLIDICFMISQDGRMIFGEVSPDCMRVQSANAESLDKDIWRQGGSGELVLQKWQRLTELIERQGNDQVRNQQ